MNPMDLTTGNIVSHIRRIAIPASTGFLFNTLFNVVDAYFAGYLGKGPLAGLALSFPVFFMVIALSAGIGTGSTALLSIALGRKKVDEYQKLAFASLLLGVALSIVLTFTGSNLSHVLFQWIGADPSAIQYGLEYTNVIFYGSFFFVMNYVLNALLNAQGDTKSFRNSIIAAFVLNLFLDPLFTRGWFGLPNFGLAGIAAATILAQALATFYLAYKFGKSPLFWRDALQHCKICFQSMWSILKQGIPASMSMITISIGSFIITGFVSKYGGSDALGAYGLAFRVEQLALLLNVGINIAVLTITGQNFGVKNFKRIYEVYKVALVIGVSILTIGILIIYPLAGPLIRLFSSDESIIKIGSDYLRVEVFAFYTYVILFISNSILQGVKKPAFGLYISLYRQILVPFLLFPFLGSALNWGIFGVWWGIVITNWTAAAIAVAFTLWTLKKVEEESEHPPVPLSQPSPSTI